MEQKITVRQSVTNGLSVYLSVVLDHSTDSVWFEVRSIRGTSVFNDLRSAKVCFEKCEKEVAK